MTHLLTRLYANEGTVDAICDRLSMDGFPLYKLRTITMHAGEDTVALAARIARAKVPASAAEAYASAMTSGQALLLVTADYKPLGARKIASAILGKTDSIDVGLTDPDFKLAWEEDHAPSILKDHPRFFTAPADPSYPVMSVSEQMGFGTLSTKTRRIRVGKGGPVLPMGTLSRGRTARSAMSGRRHILPLKLLNSAPRRLSVSRRGGPVLSRLFGIGTLT